MLVYYKMYDLVYIFDIKTKKEQRKMANEQNLRPCKKGQTNNPNGRPKGTKNIKTLLKKYLNMDIKEINDLTGKEEQLTPQDKIVIKAIKQAMLGNDNARKFVRDTMYGRPKETVENIGPQKIIIEREHEID
jgi:hypothetical protein